jgi:hypothetical protein
MSVPNPFESTAVALHMRGWHPLTLWDAESPAGRRNRGKKNPPKGTTGRAGVNATREQIEAWRDSGRYFNIASRMPDTVVALDIDARHGGTTTLEELEQHLGRLPGTYSSTARDDGSRHLYFQVPGRRIWRNPGEGIEVLHWGWRYAVFPPSIHPETGTPYAWYGPDGTRLANQLGPTPGDLRPLPAKWAQFLDTREDPARVAARVDLTDAEVRGLLEEWASDDPPCHHMRKVLDKFLGCAGSRHDSCMPAQMAILRYGEAGHPGARTALRELRAMFYASLAGERDGTAEFTRGIDDAVEKIQVTPTPDPLRGCLPLVRLIAPTVQVTVPTVKL